MKWNKDDVGRKGMFLGRFVFKRLWKVVYVKFFKFFGFFRKCLCIFNLKIIILGYVRILEDRVKFVEKKFV